MELKKTENQVCFFLVFNDGSLGRGLQGSSCLIHMGITAAGLTLLGSGKPVVRVSARYYSRGHKDEVEYLHPQAS